MKRYVFASHYTMAQGIMEAVQFLTKSDDPMYAVCAYMGEDGDDELVAAIEELFAQFSPDDTVVVMTDLMSGSVNQKLFPRMGDRVLLVSGVNVPLAMQLVLSNEGELTPAYVAECVEEARQQVVCLNGAQAQLDDDDE